MSEIDEIRLRSDLILILKEEYTRTFKCRKCGSKERCRPAIIPDSEDGFIAVYGSGVDMCTHCSKWREKGEETSDNPAEYYGTGGEVDYEEVPAEGENESFV